MDPVITKLALSAANQITKPITGAATKKARDLVLGPDELRALQKVNQRAMRRASEAALKDASIVDISHVLSLLELLVAEQQREGMTLAADDKADFTSTEALRWNAIAERAGLDAATLPINLETLVVTLLASFRSELETEVNVPGSPLFAAFLLAEVKQLQADLEVLHLTPLQSGLARNLQLEAVLADALDAARARAELNNRMLFTPDVLGALLAIQGGSSGEVFEAVETGLSAKMRRVVSRFLASPASASYSPVEWTSRADVRLAQDFAWLDGLPDVRESHLLCAILKTRSSTQRQLQEWLGPRYRLLCGFAAEARAKNTSPATPFISFTTPTNNE
jgi:hypothetical protein